ncbi:helix-turn-helix transcriptional regulator [Enterocloster lavalensis]|nr:helix-turn-helix transcriptional regulator [Enterocloster lavalensis]
MSFAARLKQIRKEKGLSQEDLAELLDVSRQAVSKWEQGDSLR